MSDLDEPLPPGAGDEEEAPPGTEQAQEATQVDGLGAGKPEESVQPAAQPGADYASYYGQDQSYYGQQYAYPGYYGQGYPDAAAGYYPGWEGYTGQTGYPQDQAYAQPDASYAGAATTKAEQTGAAVTAPSAPAADKLAGAELPGPPPPPPTAAAANASAAQPTQPVVQVLSLSAEEREAAEKEAAEAKAAALAASSNPEQIPSNGPVQPEASTPEAAQVQRETSGINEQLFAQMLQAQQAAANADGIASDPASADRQTTADGKKKGPVMLKGARLAFSRPGIISGHQPHLNRASLGSQGNENETASLENAKSGSTDQLQRPTSMNLDRNASGQDVAVAPAPGPKPPTPKKERYLPSFSRSPLRPRQLSPTPAPEPPRPAPRDPSPDSWQASPEPEAPKRRRRHRSSKDDASGGKRKRRKHRSRAEPSMTPEPAPEERDAERPHR